MKGLYDIIGFLPEFMQGPILTFMLIVMGYTVAKLLAAVIISCLPRRADIEGFDAMAMPNRWPRMTFWGVWLVFIVLGFNQLPWLAAAIDKLHIQPSNFSVQFIAVLGAVLLAMADPWMRQVCETVKVSYESGALAKISAGLQISRFRIIYGCLFFASFVLFTLLSDFSLRLIAIIRTALFGVAFGKVVKAFTTSLLGHKSADQNVVHNIIFYFIALIFIISALDV